MSELLSQDKQHVETGQLPLGQTGLARQAGPPDLATLQALDEVNPSCASFPLIVIMF
jgi:hypothetical protein